MAYFDVRSWLWIVQVWVGFAQPSVEAHELKPEGSSLIGTRKGRGRSQKHRNEPELPSLVVVH